MKNDNYINGKIKALNEMKNFLVKEIKKCIDLEDNGTIQRKIGRRVANKAYTKTLEKVNLKLKRIYEFEEPLNKK